MGPGDDIYQPRPINKLEAYLEWLRADLSACMVFSSDEDAEAALENKPVWNGHQGHAARSALQREVEA
jgi:hypothetical protein